MRLISSLGLVVALVGCEASTATSDGGVDSGRVERDARVDGSDSQAADDATVEEDATVEDDATVDRDADMGASCSQEYAYANLLWDENERRPGTRLELEAFCDALPNGCPESLSGASAYQEGMLRCRLIEGCGRVMFGADAGTHGVLFVFEDDQLVGAGDHSDVVYDRAGCSDVQYQVGSWPPVPQAWADAAQTSARKPPEAAVCEAAVITDFDCDATDLAALLSGGTQG